MTRIAFLGPEGTFTEKAATEVVAPDPELIPFHTVLAELDAVRSGEVDIAVVAFENSVEGSVPISLDGLATGEPLVIVAEVVLPVSFALLVRPGTSLDAIKTVAAHSHAEPQCRSWLRTHVPTAVFEPAASNADAAREVQAGRWDAALAGAFAAPRYGLEVLVDGIHDVEGAQTRFVVVRKPQAPPPPTGADKTTMVLFPHDDHPGGLLEILAEFAKQSINLARLESRPTGDGLGQYCFSIDAEGHVDDEAMGKALVGLRQMCADIRYLGSYPRATSDPPKANRGGQSQSGINADAWLSQIRKGEPS
ncbi:MAG: prephenate dehydratase [Actinomycetes bacterium]|jgi:prephenate dehydratase